MSSAAVVISALRVKRSLKVCARRRDYFGRVYSALNKKFNFQRSFNTLSLLIYIHCSKYVKEQVIFSYKQPIYSIAIGQDRYIFLQHLEEGSKFETPTISIALMLIKMYEFLQL